MPSFNRLALSLHQPPWQVVLLGWTHTRRGLQLRTQIANGVPRQECPYPPSTQEYYDWLIGWDDAEAIDFEEEKNP